MAEKIVLPKLAWDMNEGVLVEWLVDDGAIVSKGQPIYTLETDKTNTEIEAPAGGRLRHMGVIGEVYPVGTVIGEIDAA